MGRGLEQKLSLAERIEVESEHKVAAKCLQKKKTGKGEKVLETILTSFNCLPQLRNSVFVKEELRWQRSRGTLGSPRLSDTAVLRSDYLEHPENQSAEWQEDLHCWRATAWQRRGVWM